MQVVGNTTDDNINSSNSSGTRGKTYGSNGISTCNECGTSKGINAGDVEMSRFEESSTMPEREPFHDASVPSKQMGRSVPVFTSGSSKRRRRKYGSCAASSTTALDEFDFSETAVDVGGGKDASTSTGTECLRHGITTRSTMSTCAHRLIGRSRVSQQSLPGLLHLREIGLSSCIGRYRHWAHQYDRVWGDKYGRWRSLALCKPSNDSSSKSSSPWRWEWKSNARRSIAFRALDTPPIDAVLALARDASYMIALGGTARCRRGGLGTATGTAGRAPALALRFYGVPSLAALEQHKHDHPSCGKPAPMSPLFLTIPLLLDSAESTENRNLTAPSLLLGESTSCAAANTPVRMLMSCDGAIGVAFLLHSTSASEIAPALPNAALVGSPAVQDEDALGTLYIFRLPGACNQSSVMVKSFKCSNVRVIGNLRSHTTRNLLWPTNCFPMPNIGGSTSAVEGWCSGFRKTLSRGYLLLNDEDDGFRMTWITINDKQDEGMERRSEHKRSSATKYSVKASRPDIICATDNSGWDGLFSERFSGCISSVSDADCTAPSLHIGHEAFFSLEALLSEIMSRRKRMFATCLSMPDYFYNLISVSDDGRALKLILVFALRKKSTQKDPKKKIATPAAVGVFIEFDMFDTSYNEVEWVQHPRLSDSRFLRSWCNTLAVAHRMRDMRVGPYRYKQGGALLQNYASSGIGFHEDNADRNGPEDLDPSVWMVGNGGQDDGERPPRIAMSSLYPFCDVVSNEAVTSAEPVMRIACRDSPIELGYK